MMNGTFWRYGLVCAALGAVVACSSPQPQPLSATSTPSASPAGPAPVNPAWTSTPGAAPNAGLQPLGPIAPIPRPAEEDTGLIRRDPDAGRVQAATEEHRQMLAGASKELAEQREREDRLIGLYLEHANKARAENNYLEALRDCDRILEIRPLHPDAARLRDEIRYLVGDLEATLRTEKDTLHAQYTVLREKARAEAQSEYAKGNSAFQEARYNEAIEHFERCVEIIEFSPNDLDLSNIKKNAEAGVADAHRRRQERRREEDAMARRQAVRIAQIERDRRLRERKNEIYRLLLQAQENFKLQRHGQAKENLNRVLALDPKNTRAQRMLETVKHAELNELSQSYISNRVEQWRLQIQEWKDSQIPYTMPEGVIFPDAADWERISQRQFLEAQATERVEDPQVRHIRNVLETKKVDLSFDRMPFSQVIAYLAQDGGINIVLSQEVQAEKSQEEVSLSVNNLKLGDALNILLNFHELDYEFREGVLFVKKKGQVSSEALLKIHDIRDIIRPLESFTPMELSLPESSAGAGMMGPSFEEPDEAATTIDVEQIMELIRGSIEPESWDGESFSITQTPDNQLLVYHTPEVQGRVRTLLDSLRKNSGLLVAVEAKFINISDDFLESFGLDFRGLGGSRGTLAPLEDLSGQNFAGGLFDNGANGAPTTPPSSGFFFNDNSDGDLRARTELFFDNPLGDQLTDRGGGALQFVYLAQGQRSGVNNVELAAVLELVEKNRTATVLTAPRLVAYNTQRANIAVVDQIAYIRDFDVEVAQGVAVADPIIGTVPDGLVLDITPTVSNDRKYITLELRPTLARLIRPIPTFTTNLGNAGGQSVTIQIPEITQHKAETTVKVPDGGSVLIGGLKKVRDVNQITEVPWLAKLPIIGNFFKRQARAIEQDNMIIVITAKIVDLKDEEWKQVGR